MFDNMYLYIYKYMYFNNIILYNDIYIISHLGKKYTYELALRKHVMQTE